MPNFDVISILVHPFSGIIFCTFITFSDVIHEVSEMLGILKEMIQKLCNFRHVFDKVSSGYGVDVFNNSRKQRFYL